jgi:hypothetical protein
MFVPSLSWQIVICPAKRALKKLGSTAKKFAHLRFPRDDTGSRVVQMRQHIIREILRNLPAPCGREQG